MTSPRVATRSTFSLALLLVLTLQACTEAEPVKPASEAPVQTAKPQADDDVQPVRAGQTASDERPSLSADWIANGFEQLGQQYEWGGSGERDGDLQPHFWLAVPETDDTVWSSECADGGKIKTMVYLQRPEDLVGDSTRFRFETDLSMATLDYPASYVSGQQSDGFEFIQDANDPMFARMKTGQWAYLKLGDGPTATKLRISLANAGNALDAFLPACMAR